ncbi:NAD(P)/FAD-dependent oxidoreductase [Williamsia deligens]|uniref:NAD(P)/FAD-dependent oxidoreductase n=1 Tax=Williamsia deligens TaxID=321325 RepID=A0ABW3G383_9NOCA|nr:FAD-dependent oxidoreductase [Williamsia deligens]
METALLVVGSGPAGVAAAQAYRENGGRGRVVVVTPEAHRPYWRPPLSKDFLRGEVGIDDIALQPDEFYTENDIEVLTGTTVSGLDPDRHEVRTGDGETIVYDSLVLATGAAPVPLPAPGGERVPTLRSMADAEALQGWAAGASSALVMGGGFIGCEAAASLAARGVATTVVAPDAVPQDRRLGPDAGRRLAGILEQAGVRYVGGAHVESVSGAPGEGMAAVLDAGVTVDVDLVLAATGVTPRTDLAADAGLAMRSERIAVDASMRTSAPDVYAAGDVASAVNATAGRPISTEHWQDAEDQGRVAGAVAAGADAQWDAVPGFWTEIAGATVKYSAWGDGHADAIAVHHDDGGLTVWYVDGSGVVVGVLTHNCDDDYERGGELIAQGSAAPVSARS